MTNPTEIQNAAAGVAALAICESLLLALSDLKIIGARDAAGVLEDAAAAHRHAGAGTPSAALHQEVVVAIDRIMTAGKSTFQP